MEQIFDIPKLFVLEVVTSIICGAIIGIERELRDKPAGLRTSILICLGTTIFVRLGLSFNEASADPTRVLGQVVTGIGFLGAGVILVRGEIVRGVTTASIIWILAAIGATVGLGYLMLSLLLSILTVFILVGISILEDYIKTTGIGRRNSKG